MFTYYKLFIQITRYKFYGVETRDITGFSLLLNFFTKKKKNHSIVFIVPSSVHKTLCKIKIIQLLMYTL